MKNFWGKITQNWRPFFLLLIVMIVVSGLLLYKLGSLVGGLSAGEYRAGTMPLSISDIYERIMYLPLLVMRAVVFHVFSDHGQTLTRFPNVIFGLIAMSAVSAVLYFWHGRRTAILASALFITSSWVLHASRLASYDVLYLMAVPLLLLCHVALSRDPENPYAFYGSALVWGSLLYIPGMVWLVGLEIWLQRSQLAQGWKYRSIFWERVAFLMVGILTLPLLIIALLRPGIFKLWLGLPEHFGSILHISKSVAEVPYHLLINGPGYPEIWLGRLPILDVFTLTMFIIGAIFYVRRRDAARSKLLGMYLFLGIILVGLSGPVKLSLLAPLLYLVAATGIAYLLQIWLKTFPKNPLARGLGIGLLSLAVALACMYNLRSYFTAWPHNPVTHTVFRYHL